MNKNAISLFIGFGSLAFFALTPLKVTAQEGPLVIEPLFEYVQAPDTMLQLQDRSDFMVEHFWDKMDFSDKKTVDQNALNDAFTYYVAPMRFASEEIVNRSIETMLTRLTKNPVLSIQFTKGAEEALYGPRANFWSDEIYLKFIDGLLKNKGVKKERKLRYERQKTLLTNTLVGSIPPQFEYITPEGKKALYHPNGVITVIEFGDPDCDECRMAKLKMDTDVTFSSLVEKGKVNVLFINVDPEEGWEERLASYPATWHVGASDKVGDLYDLRATPSIYVIDREGHVAAKNVDVLTAMRIASAAVE